MKKTKNKNKRISTYTPLDAQTWGIFEAAPGPRVGVRLINHENLIFWVSNEATQKFLLVNCNREDYASAKEHLKNFVLSDPEFDQEQYQAGLFSLEYLTPEEIAFFNDLTQELHLKYTAAETRRLPCLVTFNHLDAHVLEGRPMESAQAVELRTQDEVDLAKECRAFMTLRHRIGKHLAAKELHSVTDHNAGTFPSDAAQEYVNAKSTEIFKTLSGASPLLPYHNLKEQIAIDTYAIAALLGRTTSGNQEPDALAILQRLTRIYSNPVTPLQPISADSRDIDFKGVTPLHYAFAQLDTYAEHHYSYKLKILIIMFMILGGRDLEDANGRSAISFFQGEDFLDLVLASNGLYILHKTGTVQKENASIELGDYFAALLRLLLQYEFAIKNYANEQLTIELQRLNQRISQEISAQLPVALDLPLMTADEVSIPKAQLRYVGAALHGQRVICIIFNKATKISLAISPHSETSIAAIVKRVSKFIGTDSVDQYSCALGYTKDEAVVAVLEIRRALLNLGFTNAQIETCQADPATKSNFVFDLFHGKAKLVGTNEVRFVAVDGRNMYESCKLVAMQFLHSRLVNIVNEFLPENYAKAKQSYDPRSLEIIRSRISEGACTPLLPLWDLDHKISNRLNSMAYYVQNGKFEELLKLLLNPIVNPITHIDRNNNAGTPLHYACIRVNETADEHQHNFVYKLIVALLLLFGKRDLANHQGRYALDMLHDGKFRKVCKDFLENAQCDDVRIGITSHQIVTMHVLVDVYYSWITDSVGHAEPKKLAESLWRDVIIGMRTVGESLRSDYRYVQTQEARNKPRG